ncbi:20116_t:CDS:2 [Cetraspora pellucida]|uniref:20116_t:CDS:1 n=1 Tax=Cetraspora pellucida TaxID=1433469 RepID=A0A9N8Z6L6_9GLOM|nr:20116_t:CDS:2 [Cetraspora pellucida]
MIRRAGILINVFAEMNLKNEKRGEVKNSLATTKFEYRGKSESDYNQYLEQRKANESLVEIIDKFIDYTNARNVTCDDYASYYTDYFAWEERIFRDEKEQEIYDLLRPE